MKSMLSTKMKSIVQSVFKWKRPRRNHANHQKVSDLLKESTESVALTANRAKLKVAEIVFGPEQRRVTPIARGLLELKSAKIHLAPTRYPERSGSVVAKSL
tara:strand:- start:321 stop:623 length:303 start_codon:yes stop_codon:yes gene_type:complete